MKRFQLIFLVAGAFAALLAAMIFSRAGQVAVRPGTANSAASSTQDALPAVAPDALASQNKPTSTPAFNLNAKAAAVGNLSTGEVLYGFNADARWPIASITKLMTAEIVLDRLNPDAIIAMAPEDFAFGGNGLTANLQPEDQYRVADLLKIMLVPSSNEAAEAFARSHGRTAFLAAMNAKAQTWGLQGTHFADPSGISVANQSTPREFLKLVSNIYASHPEIFAITQARAVAVKEIRTGLFKHFSTTNNFSGRAGFLGGKTGTTPEAGDNLVSIFQTAGGPVAILVFGADDRYAATESLLQFVQ